MKIKHIVMSLMIIPCALYSMDSVEDSMTGKEYFFYQRMNDVHNRFSKINLDGFDHQVCKFDPKYDLLKNMKPTAIKLSIYRKLPIENTASNPIKVITVLKVKRYISALATINLEAEKISDYITKMKDQLDVYHVSLGNEREDCHSEGNMRKILTTFDVKIVDVKLPAYAEATASTQDKLAHHERY